MIMISNSSKMIIRSRMMSNNRMMNNNREIINVRNWMISRWLLTVSNIVRLNIQILDR